MAAKIPMMATTIINSMSVKPFCSLVISKLLLAVPVRDVVVRKCRTPTRLPADFASGVPGPSRYVKFRVTQGAERHARATPIRRATYFAITFTPDRRITGTNRPRMSARFALRRHSHDRRRLLDAQLLDAIAQRSERQAEQLGGGRLVVASLLERRDDGVALDLLELRAERGAAITACAPRRIVAVVVAVLVAQMQVGEVDLVARAKRQRALENVLELTYVAGESVREQRLLRGRRQVRRPHSLLRSEPCQRVMREHQHVLAALA